MTRKRLRGWILLAGILALTVILLGSRFILNRTLTPDLLFPRISSGPSVTILSPGDHSRYPADASIPIIISVTSQHSMSTVELWADGALLEAYQPEVNGGQQYLHQFKWTPAGPGNYRLIARATNRDGSTTNSNPVAIQISEPAGARLISTDENGTVISEVSFPVLTESSAPPANSGITDSQHQGIPHGAPLEFDLTRWLTGQAQTAKSPPRSPGLTASVQNCQAILIIEDRSVDELGFIIYRSGGTSSSFQRISELQNTTGESTFIYLDPNPVRDAIYYAAAFNISGENPSTPIQINDLDPSCYGSEDIGSLNGLNVEDLEILDLAYIYYSLDGSGYRRFPPDPDIFLTPSEYPTSLNTLVEGLISSSDSLVRKADLVLWGWSGGSLVNLGAFQLDIDSSRLQVCNLGTDCTGDVASSFRSTFGELAIDAEDQQRQFFWSTTAPDTTAILWQITTSPFTGGFSPHPYGLVAAGCSEGGSAGSFLVDFKSLDSYLPAPSACGEFSLSGINFSKFDWKAALFDTSEIHYYVRFIPFHGSQPSGKPSNSVEILARPGESIIEPVIVDHLPEIYQVEVIDYTPIKNMDPRYWGCVYITGLDYDAIWNYYRSQYPANITDAMIDQFADQIYNDLNYAVQNGLVVCPAPYQSSGSGSVISEWGSMLVDSLQEIWEGVVSAFNSLKAEVVDQVASAINALGIPCDSECRAGLKLGMEIGFTYFTGIPPNLPSFEQLKEQGLEYAVEMAAAEAGIPCPEQCQQILREGLEDVIDAAARNSQQPGCVDENWANALGKHSLCLPPGVDTAAVPEGVSEPARAVIRVSRTGQESPGEYKYGGQPAYMVNIRFSGENNLLSGITIPYTYRYLDWDKGYQQFFTIDVPVSRLQNDVFDSQSVPIPPLAPGESITIPLSLSPHTYYIPEHLHSLMIELNSRDLEVNDVGGVGGSRGTLFDWLCLHNGGQLKIEASVTCLSVPEGLIGNSLPDEDSELVPCGSEAQPYYYQETSDVCYP